MKRRQRGSGTIETFRDRDGKLRYRARVPRADGTREPLGVHPTREAAELAIDAARTRSAELVRMTGATVRDYGPRFLDFREQTGTRGVRVERNRWKTLVDASPLADLPMKSVTRADAKSWLRWLLTRKIKYAQKHPRNGKTMSRVTLQNALNLIRKAFDEARDEELVTGSNPFDGIYVPKGEGRTHEPWTYLTPDEQAALAIAAEEAGFFEGPRWALVEFALFSGLRQAEQWSLRWEDVSKTGVTVRYGEAGKPTKGGRIRRVPFIGNALQAIDYQRAQRGRGESLVFPNLRGSRRFKGEPSWWKDLLCKAGLGDPAKRHDGRSVRWHDLRHTCASSLVAGWWGRRWSLYEVKEMLGHRSITTTERYAHLAGSVLDEAARETRGTKPAVSPASSSNQDSTSQERPAES